MEFMDGREFVDVCLLHKYCNEYFWSRDKDMLPLSCKLSSQTNEAYKKYIAYLTLCLSPNVYIKGDLPRNNSFTPIEDLIILDSLEIISKRSKDMTFDENALQSAVELHEKGIVNRTWQGIEVRIYRLFGREHEYKVDAKKKNQ